MARRKPLFSFNLYIGLELAIWFGLRALTHHNPFPSEPQVYIYNVGIATAIYFFFKIVTYFIHKKRLAGSSMKQIDKMTGEEFEQYLGILYKKKGYKVKFTPGTMDFGADLILEKDGIRSVVQAKRYRNSVGEASVQQALSGKEYYEADKCAVVTNSSFTNAAQILAKKCGITLIDRQKLYKGRIVF